MRTRIIHWYNYLLSTLLYLLGFGMMGCTEQGDEYGPKPVMYGPAPITDDDWIPNTDIKETIDPYYRPSLGEIQGEWIGEYEGWDENQQKIAQIRRKLTLYANGRYTNLICGRFAGDDVRNEFTEFEMEEGTFLYNSRNSIITYTVESDSILDYRSQKFDGYERKKYFYHQDMAYTEKVMFTTERSGLRRWVTQDPTLLYVEDKTKPVAYAMGKQK